MHTSSSRESELLPSPPFPQTTGEPMTEPTPGPVEDREIPARAPITLLPLLALLLLGLLWG